MKKHCLTLAAATLAAAAAASAQPNVTVFGVIDAGISHYSVKGGERDTTMSTDGLTSSRLGFRGREDLGGGLSAQFWVEGGINAATPGAFELTRRSTIGLAGRFGEVRLGRDYTPTFMIQSAFSGPWVTNGVGHSLVYRARATLYGSSNAGQPTHVRSSNAVSYFLPSGLGGFTGHFQYAFPEADDGSKAGRYGGVRLGYKRGALGLGVAYSHTDGGAGAPASKPRDVDSFSLGASYDFGVAALEGLVVRDKVPMPLGDRRLKGFTVGLTVPAGAGEFRASYGRISFGYPKDAFGASKIALGYVHKLSKRTALYATLAHVSNRDGGKFTVGGSPAGIADRSSTGQDVGIRVSF